ncbi:hypothetical protein JOB18_006785 [Solea senegalensis]|uniref:Uncharacterized protein n=1 Tax=Solea senegalensis TaxID=28829 RepID=A0AAV6QG05_SOLSE|nr:hypothetical protein JOB18_006785 [Solea senegalensis]
MARSMGSCTTFNHKRVLSTGRSPIPHTDMTDMRTASSSAITPLHNGNRTPKLWSPAREMDHSAEVLQGHNPCCAFKRRPSTPKIYEHILHCIPVEG